MLKHELQQIRPATSSDVALIHGLICELAVYEKMLDQVVATEAMTHEALFGERPSAEAIVAEYDGQGVGFALYFPSYSTFSGRQKLYLEDLYVKPDFRGHGIGKALLAALAEIAKVRGYARMEWSVLDWNEPAIRFYESLGAEIQKQWRLVSWEL